VKKRQKSEEEEVCCHVFLVAHRLNVENHFDWLILLYVQFNLKVPFKSHLFHDQQTRYAIASKNNTGQKLPMLCNILNAFKTSMRQ